MLRLMSVFTVATALVAVASPVLAAKGDGADCFRDLTRGRSQMIVCELPLKPDARETAELARQSRGYVKHAECRVSIRIERALITAAVETLDHEFIAPAQPVACTVTMGGKDRDSVMPISATFAPRIKIIGGRAVDATPGLADIQGVSRVLSWPVETWMNSGIGIKSNMLQVINAWLDHMRNDVVAQRR